MNTRIKNALRASTLIDGPHEVSRIRIIPAGSSLGAAATCPFCADTARFQHDAWRACSHFVGEDDDKTAVFAAARGRMHSCWSCGEWVDDDVMECGHCGEHTDADTMIDAEILGDMAREA